MAGGILGNVRGPVARAAGPWRGSGDWWNQNVWDREEWDLGLNDGGLYRAFSARSARVEEDRRDWFLEGSYD